MASPVKAARAKHEADGFTEVLKRTKGGLESRNPITGRRAMTVVAGGRGYHFGDGPFDASNEVDTAWQASGGAWDWQITDADYHAFIRDSVPVSYRYEDAATGHFVELTFTSIQWVNDEGQSEQAAAFSQVTPSITDDVIQWSEIATGWNVRVQALPTKFAKWIDISSLTPPTIGGTNIRLRFQLTWQRSNGLQIWANGSQWDEKNNTWVETAGAIEFRDSVSGDVIFAFAQPIGYDDPLDSQAVMAQRVRRLGANFYSEIFTAWSWLETAQYPVHLDTTIDVATAASNQDAIENSDTSTSITANTPTINSSVPYMGAYFTLTSAIGTSDTINTSYSTITVVNQKTINVDITADDSDGPGVFDGTSSDISGRTDTTASVEWTETVASNNTPYPSPSINSIISELAASGYLDGGTDAVVLIFHDRGSSNWRVYHYDQGANYPELYIDFTAGGYTPLTAAAGTLDFAGTATGLIAGRMLTAAAKALSFTGTATGLTVARKLTAAAGALSFTGTATGLTVSRKLTAEAGALTFTGTSTGLARGYTLTAEAGALSFTGTATGLTVSRKLTAAAGALTFTGVAAGLTYSAGYLLTAESGTLSFTGTATGLTVTRKLTAAAGALTFAGTATGLTVSRKLTADAGALTFTGVAAGLTYTPVGGYTITAEAGALSLTGTATGLTVSRKLTAGAGTLALSGTATGLTVTRKLVAVAGTITFNGVAVTFTRTYAITASAGSFTLTGVAAGLTYSGAAIQIYTASLYCNPSPADNLFCNISPAANVESNPSPSEDVYIG